MLETIFSQLAPHYCLSCGEIGSQICLNCFFDIELSPRPTCIKCHGLLVGHTCKGCVELEGITQLVLASREGILERLIDDYKFRCTKETYKILAKLYDSGLPYLPEDTILVPLPTSAAHIRRRGFDHTRDIVQELGKLRGLPASLLLSRRHNAAQFGASYRQRQRSAQAAFELARKAQIDKEATYVILDDIITTGASMTAAASKLREAGARRVIAVALLQQPWK